MTEKSGFVFCEFEDFMKKITDERPKATISKTEMAWFKVLYLHGQANGIDKLTVAHEISCKSFNDCARSLTFEILEHLTYAQTLNAQTLGNNNENS